MFYIRTADRLQRTARWLEQLPGGLKYLQQVVLEDKLGICASLEAQMQELVDSYFDEWAEALKDPAIAAKFRQFANTDEAVAATETESDRAQTRPVFWRASPPPRTSRACAAAGPRWPGSPWSRLRFLRAPTTRPTE